MADLFTVLLVYDVLFKHQFYWLASCTDHFILVRHLILHIIEQSFILLVTEIVVQQILNNITNIVVHVICWGHHYTKLFYWFNDVKTSSFLMCISNLWCLCIVILSNALQRDLMVWLWLTIKSVCVCVHWDSHNFVCTVKSSCYKWGVWCMVDAESTSCHF